MTTENAGDSCLNLAWLGGTKRNPPHINVDQVSLLFVIQDVNREILFNSALSVICCVVFCALLIVYFILFPSGLQIVCK